MADLHDLIKTASQKVEEEWGVFNDPEFWEPKFDSGEIHEELRGPILDNPLFTSPIPGPAKRYQEYFNKQREDYNQVETAGYAVLKVQEVVKTPWRTVTGEEWDGIDNGKAPSGR